MNINRLLSFSVDEITTACKSVGFINISSDNLSINLVKITNLGRMHVILTPLLEMLTRFNIHHDIYGPFGGHYCKSKDTVPNKFYSIIMNELYNGRNKR